MNDPGSTSSRTLSSQEWARVRAALEWALERPEPEREDWLSACLVAEPELLERAIALLRRDEGHASSSAPACGATPRVLGAWTLERELASGGMGTVWLARRSSGGFEQLAAVKLVRRGLESESALRLFVRERALLARLEHPGIARLLDGGIGPEQQPYLVMEFVEGRPIDRFCDERGLGLVARVELLRKVCAAVSYLHQHLVVHRDLKPSNVLVTGAGEPKLVDFGIAKVLDEAQESGATVTQGRILTPGYASPEQLRGEPVTTASDVFALGVLAYELLAGAHPFRAPGRAQTQLERLVLESDPPPPSALCADAARARRLRGDLDTIVLTALRKEPERRYASAEELSADLGRHLASLPVHARPESRLYLASRFARRHRAAVIASLCFVLALVGGLATSLRLYVGQRAARREADEKRELAAARFESLRELTAHHLIELHDRLYELEGSMAARESLIATLSSELLRLAAEEPRDPAVRLALARAWRRTGLAQGDPNWQSLGRFEDALASHEKARALLLALRGSGLDARELDLEHARNERNRGSLLALLGRSGAALEALESAAGAAAPHARELGALDVLAPAARERAALLIDRGQHAQAQQALERARELDHTLAEHPDARREPSLERVLQRSAREGAALAAEGAHAEALECYAQALARFEAEQGMAHAGLRRRRQELLLLGAQSLVASGRASQAESSVAEVLAEREGRALRDPLDFQARADLAHALEARAAVRAALDDSAAALDDLERALRLREELARERPGAARLQRELAEGWDRLGEHLRRAGRAREAVKLHERALESFERLLVGDPENETLRRDLSVCLYALAWAHLELHSDALLPLEERIAELELARTHLDASRSILLEQRARGSLRPSDASILDGHSRSLEQMDRQLERLVEGHLSGG